MKTQLRHMDFGKANQLQEEWNRKGNPPCDHPVTDKERIGGMDTGDVRCVVCGANVDTAKPKNESD